MVSRITQLFIGALAGVMFSVTAYASQVQYPRIIGGSELDTVYPWMVSLQSRNNTGNYEHFCGGTLIDPYWVLTAGHCVEGTEPSDLRLMIGDLDLDETSVEATTEIRSVQRIVINEGYRDEFGVDNDIALLRLASPSGNDIAPLISTAEMSGISAATNGLVMGWGRTRTAVRSDNLKQVSLRIRTEAECRDAIPNVYDNGLLCAGGVQNEDSCNGDSGGPLMIEVGGTLKHAGIVSFGYAEACATAGAYGVYTRVATYLEWIESKLDRVALTTLPDFGYTIPYITQSSTLEFVNFSSSDVTLASAQVAGANPANFVIIDSDCEVLLPPNGYCSITLQATPTSNGVEETANLQIITDSPDTPVLETELSITTLKSLNTNDALYDDDHSWFTGGSRPWTESSKSLDGVSLGSGQIEDNEQSVLAVNVSDINELTVRVKVSSESRYDGLVILRDDRFYQFISGEQDWDLMTIPTTNTEIVEFIYFKDISLSEGSDRAWIESEELKDSGGGGGSLTTFSAVLLTLLALRRRSKHLRCH